MYAPATFFSPRLHSLVDECTQHHGRHLISTSFPLLLTKHAKAPARTTDARIEGEGVVFFHVPKTGRNTIPAPRGSDSSSYFFWCGGGQQHFEDWLSWGL